MHVSFGMYSTVIVPKSGRPVLGHTEVNSGFTCVIVNRRPGRGFGNVSRFMVQRYGLYKERRLPFQADAVVQEHDLHIALGCVVNTPYAVISPLDTTSVVP